MALHPGTAKHYLTAQPIFRKRRKIVSARFIGDATSLKYYVTSHKSYNYETVPKRQVVAGIILHQKIKISHNLKPVSTSERPKIILSTSEAKEVHTASWKAQKHIPCVHGSPWHSFASSFSDSVWLSLLYISTVKSSLVTTYCSTWRHFYEAIWLERHQCGAWNKSGIGRWPDYRYFSLRMRKIDWARD